MKIEQSKGVVTMTISDRNLDTLVAQRKLGKQPFLNRLQEDNTVIRIFVESDEVHYKDAPEDRRVGAPSILMTLRDAKEN